MKSKITMTEHLEKHKNKELKFWRFSKYYKDEKKYIIIRPLSGLDFWMETNDGEGTGIGGGILYEHLMKLFKEVM